MSILFDLLDALTMLSNFLLFLHVVLPAALTAAGMTAVTVSAVLTVALEMKANVLAALASLINRLWSVAALVEYIKVKE